MPANYRANRDLTFIGKGRLFTERKVPEGVSLLALLRGGLVSIVHPKPDTVEDDD